MLNFDGDGLPKQVFTLSSRAESSRVIRRMSNGDGGKAFWEGDIFMLLLAHWPGVTCHTRFGRNAF
jgi:hypothetical protein